MSSKKPEKFIGSHSAKELNRLFYERFEENYWLNKADALINIIENFDDIKNMLGENWKIETPKEKFLVNLYAEIYFTSFHMAEATFALLLAPFQGNPHWIYMVTYNSIRESVNKYINGEIEELTSEKCTTKKELVEHSVYFGFSPEDEKEKDDWNKNINNIVWMLDRIGEKYVRATGYRKGEYNSYKHGLRIETNIQSLSVHENGHPEKSNWIAPPKEAIAYLEIEEKEADGEKVGVLYEITKQFSYKEAYNYILFMTFLLKNVKNTRIAVLSGKTPELKGLPNLDKKQIRDISAYAGWRISL